MSKSITYRLDEDITPALKKIAKDKDRSVNWLVNDLLKKFVEKENKKGKLNNLSALAKPFLKNLNITFCGLAFGFWLTECFKLPQC